MAKICASFFTAHVYDTLAYTHPLSKVQETSLTAIKVIVNGTGIQHLLEARAKASSSSPHKLGAGAPGKKVEKKKTEEDTGKYGVVIEACLQFITGYLLYFACVTSADTLLALIGRM